MYKVSIKNMQLVQQTFSLLNTEYLDVYVTPDYVRLVGSTSELFLQAMFDATTTVDSKGKNCEFRINRKLFLSTASVGNFIILDDGDNITISFYNGNIMVRKITFAKQIVFAQKYAEQIRLLSEINLDECKEFSLANFKQVIKAAKFLNTKMCITDGAVSVDGGSSMKMFIPYKGMTTMGINGTALSVLNTINTNLRTVGFYICSEFENIVAMLKKERVATNDEVALILNNKSKYIATVDLSNVFTFLKKIKVTEDKVDYDFDSKMITLKFESTIINLPILVKEEQKATGSSAAKFSMSLAMIRFIESIFKTNESFKLYCKRNFTVLEQGGAYLVF